jgi:predicted O-linked N-acetylglucosamine transferase (SPINDLY family)
LRVTAASKDLSQAFRAAVDSHLAGNLDAAAAAYREILSVSPTHPGALHLLGVLSGQQGDHRTALDFISQALRYDPQLPEAHYNLGFNLERLGDFVQASESYRRALALAPNYAEAHNNLGNVLGELGLWSAAVGHYERVQSLTPTDASAYNNLGTAFLNQCCYAAAADAYRRALDLKPDHSEAHSNLLLALNYDPSVGSNRIFAEHQAWGEAHAASLERPMHANSRDSDRRLRVGYVSGDLWRHAVSAFFEPLLDSHDRTEFEVFCYANSLRHDETTQRLKANADHWTSIAGQDDRAVAERIRNDAIDILVDLSGHTARNRLKLFGLKPAPVRITWLGYPNTTGLRAMDYRITDLVADPPGEADRLHAERLMRLQRSFLCYRPPQDAPPPAPLPARAAGYVTFGSFNTLAKVTADSVRVWSRILRAVPESRLYLKARALRDPHMQKKFASLFVQFGIEPGRLAMMPLVISQREHLGSYDRMDVALDPFPYNGTTTICEALWGCLS